MQGGGGGPWECEQTNATGSKSRPFQVAFGSRVLCIETVGRKHFPRKPQCPCVSLRLWLPGVYSEKGLSKLFL